MQGKWLWCAVWLSACAGSHSRDGEIEAHDEVALQRRSFDIEIYSDEVMLWGLPTSSSMTPEHGTLVLEPDGGFRLAHSGGFIEEARFLVDDRTFELADEVDFDTTCRRRSFESLGGSWRDDDDDGAADAVSLTFAGPLELLMGDFFRTGSQRGRIEGVLDVTPPRLRARGGVERLLPLGPTLSASEWIDGDEIVLRANGRDVALDRGDGPIFQTSVDETPLPFGTSWLAAVSDLAGNVAEVEMTTPEEPGLFEGWGEANATLIGGARIDDEGAHMAGDSLALLRVAVPAGTRALAIVGNGFLGVTVGFPDSPGVTRGVVDRRDWRVEVPVPSGAREAVVQLAHEEPACGAPPGSQGDLIVSTIELL